MKQVSVIGLIAIVLSLAACSKERIKGEGQTVSELRPLSNFNAVSASGSSDVFIQWGPAFSVEVTGYSNLLPYYETKLENNRLVLGFKDVNIRNENIKVYITMPGLAAVHTAGSGDIEVTGNFTGYTNFEAGISGSGNISIALGSADRFVSNISGSGNINALNFVSKKAETTTSGSGNTEITANEELKVKISGSGNVYYKGNPVVSANISGSGVVIPR